MDSSTEADRHSHTQLKYGADDGGMKAVAAIAVIGVILVAVYFAIRFALLRYFPRDT